MHIDWTVNFGDLLVMLGAAFAATAIVIRMDRRLLKVETWIELDGQRATKAIEILDTVGRALEKVTTLYEGIDKRVDRVEESVFGNGRR